MPEWGDAHGFLMLVTSATSAGGTTIFDKSGDYAAFGKYYANLGAHRSGADAHAAAAVPEVPCKGADHAPLDAKPISELAVVTDCP